MSYERERMTMSQCVVVHGLVHDHDHGPGPYSSGLCRGPNCCRQNCGPNQRWCPSYGPSYGPSYDPPKHTNHGHGHCWSQQKLHWWNHGRDLGLDVAEMSTTRVVA